MRWLHRRSRHDEVTGGADYLTTRGDVRVAREDGSALAGDDADATPAAADTDAAAAPDADADAGREGGADAGLDAAPPTNVAVTRTRVVTPVGHDVSCY